MKEVKDDGIMLDQDAELIYNGVRLNNQRGY